MMAISLSVYSRSRSASVERSATLRWTLLEHVPAVRAVHQQANDLRVGQKRAAVRMIGAHHHAPRIVDQQIPFQPDRPLQRVDERLVAVLDRRDAAAGFHFGVAAEPLAFEDVGKVITERAVARHAGRFAEHHLADVDRDVLVRVDVLGQRQRLAVERVLVAFAAAVAVELDVRDVGAVAFEGLHRFERRLPVAGHAEVVAVDVHGMRQAKLGRRLGDAADDLPRRDVEVIDRLVEAVDVAGLMALPDFDAARVHELRRVTLRRAEQPGDERLQLLRLVLAGSTA